MNCGVCYYNHSQFIYNTMMTIITAARFESQFMRKSSDDFIYYEYNQINMNIRRMKTM